MAIIFLSKTTCLKHLLRLWDSSKMQVVSYVVLFILICVALGKQREQINRIAGMKIKLANYRAQLSSGEYDLLLAHVREFAEMAGRIGKSQREDSL